MSKHLFFRAVRRLFQLYGGRYQIPTQQELDGPCVMICHHGNMVGPLYTLAYLPVGIRPWILSLFCEKEGCREQLASYTLPVRCHIPRRLAELLAWMVSGLVVRLIQDAQPIPVYRGSARSLSTCRQTVEELERGGRVILFPDVDYIAAADEEGAMYQGFALIARLYYARTGKPMDFLPVHVSRGRHVIAAGQRVRFEGGEFDRQAGSRLVQQIAREMDALTEKYGI